MSKGSVFNMNLRLSVVSVVLLCSSIAVSAPAAPSSAADAVQTPSQFLGFEVGGDRKLADYRQVVSYLKYLASKSPRIQIENMGSTTLDNEMILAAISTKENLEKKAKYQEIARKLADPRGLSQEQIDALARQGSVILLVTCN